MKKAMICALLAGLFSTQAAVAAEFVIDAQGARPKAFRITAICDGLDSYISPEPYKSGLFNSTGKSIMGHGIGLELGMQGGKTFVYIEQGGKKVIVGNADNLDRITPVAGVTFKGWQEWDMLSHAWRMKIDTGSATLAEFTGKRVDVPDAVTRLAAHAQAGGKIESQDNLRVLASFLTHHYSGFATNAHNNTLAHYVAEFRAEYADPMTKALASLTGPARQALLAIHGEVLDAAQAYRAKVASGSFFVPDERKAVLAEAMKLLEAIK